METSKGGVRIYTASDFEAPRVFTLRFQDTEARYKVIWRKGQFVGAELARLKKCLRLTHKTPAQKVLKLKDSKAVVPIISLPDGQSDPKSISPRGRI